MESIAHIWCNQEMRIWKGVSRIVAEDFQLILNSPTILQCQLLFMRNAQFSFKDYKVLYNAKIIENHCKDYEIDPDYWLQFLEQPGVKPLVVLRGLYRKCTKNVLDHLSKAFSSAVSPNAYKILFPESDERLSEFRKTNETSGEKLELKKGLLADYQKRDWDRGYFHYTLERSSI